MSVRRALIAIDPVRRRVAMKKKRSQRIKPVIRVAENREELAARALGESQQRLKQQRDTLAELEHAQREYQQRLQRAGSHGISAGELQRVRQFLDSLGEAIKQQGQRVRQAEQEYDYKRRRWAEKRSEVDALGKVADRYQQEELNREEKISQRETDAHALHRFHRDNKE
jgi:flagellar FliJ protein